MANDVGNEIKQAFNALAGGVKEAGKKRMMELVQKQGYVAFKNLQAIEQFKNNPDYKDWKCQIVGNEYRFFPPEKAKQIDDKKTILTTYKEIEKKIGINIYVTIKLSGNECDYKLISENKVTGERITVMSGKCPFDGKFSMEVLPSLYYYTSGGMPVIDNVKDNGMISFFSVDGTRVIHMSNLNKQQLEVVRDMKNYVDDKLGLRIDSSNKGWQK